MLLKLLKLTGNNNYGLLKHSTQIKLFSTEQEPRDTDPNTADKKHNKEVNELVGKYKEQDVENMLKILNNYSVNQLLGYAITKPRANKLVAYRTRYGLFKDLCDVFFVESFGPKFADKFLQSLLVEPKSLNNVVDKIIRKRAAKFITPSMEVEQRRSVTACVSVRIGVNSITWSKLVLSPEECSDPCKLTDWEYHEISEKTLHLNDLIQRCIYISRQIPLADCYLFEAPQVAQHSNKPGSVDQQNINIQKAQVTAMMGYALTARNTYNTEVFNEENGMMPTCQPAVFYARRFLTARLFNHLVGSERVSSEQTVIALMRTYYNTEDIEHRDTTADGNTEQIVSETAAQASSLNIKGNVQFPVELRGMFAQASPYCREFLGQTLLLNLAFVRLVLLQDPKSIDKVINGGMNKNDTDCEL